MNNYRTHAYEEFKHAGWINKEGEFVDEMQQMICEHVLTLLDVFADEGHSGSSAPYAINLFSTLAKFHPIGPLTGKDSEWHEVSEGIYQNKRCGEVFKDGKNGDAYWIHGRVFWNWHSDSDIDDGKPFKSYWTGKDSRVPVNFPWIRPDSPEYVFEPTDEFPHEVLDY